MQWRSWFAFIPLGVGCSLGAQALTKSVVASDGLVQVIYPSRASACGDGESFIGNIFDRRQVYVTEATLSGRNSWDSRPCVHGPARVLATVIAGEVTRIRTFVGPIPQTSSDVRTTTTSGPEAAAWLKDLVASSPSRVAAQAVLPLVLADGPDPWPALLGVARDGSRPRDVRAAAMQWLSTGVTDHLGLGNADDRGNDADEMRTQAVFVLSQRPKSESVPELIDLARHATHPSARKAAIFWLGQSGDPRAVDVYAELLGLR